MPDARRRVGNADVSALKPSAIVSSPHAPMMQARARLRRALLAWYRRHGRALRIRTTREPWAVLVSEVMAQQTQIARVDEAWVDFMARFPSPKALADASTFDVLLAWRGLGYNRRALALQRAAGVIVDRHGGQVPDTVADLEALPGVGPYTARAVAALAFGRPVAAVDTNVRRVIGRLAGAQPTRRDLQVIADGLVARRDPATWTHAVMELGAVVCRSARPACAACPVRTWCASADAVEPARAPGRAPEVPFEQSSRWLRGRIVARLREQEEGAWTELPAVMGSHGAERIAAAVAALHREGLVERRADGRVRLPSSTWT
jgi:A/G-specific adenine glycosylase